MSCASRFYNSASEGTPKGSSDNDYAERERKEETKNASPRRRWLSIVRRRAERDCAPLLLPIGIGDFLLFADSFPPLFLNIPMLARVVVIVFRRRRLIRCARLLFLLVRHPVVVVGDSRKGNQKDNGISALLARRSRRGNQEGSERRGMCKRARARSQGLSLSAPFRSVLIDVNLEGIEDSLWVRGRQLGFSFHIGRSNLVRSAIVSGF